MERGYVRGSGLKSILFLSKGEQAPSTRYRALQFMPLLAEAGYSVDHVRVSGRGGAAFLTALVKASKADVVVVLRRLFPQPLLWLLRRASRRLVFDFDDAIFCNSDGSESASRMRRFASMVKACDHVFAGNRHLSERAVPFNSAVTIIPTCLDTERYIVEAAKPQDTLDLVWIGSRSTKKYLVELLPALRLAAGRVPGLRLKVIADFDLPDAGIAVVPMPWKHDTEVYELASSHIGIAPMRDDNWSRGKCALKILQYMAVGLPVISSAVGANKEVVSSGISGYLVNGDKEWHDRIVELSSDAGLRAKMGNEGRTILLSNYSIRPVFLRMTGVFDQLM